MSNEDLSRIFVELPSFMARWKSLGLDDADLLRLEIELLNNPRLALCYRVQAAYVKFASHSKIVVKAEASA